jgi:hypothetical protein
MDWRKILAPKQVADDTFQSEISEQWFMFFSSVKAFLT